MKLKTASDMKRIYVAGPYTASDARKVRANTDRAIEIGCALISKGWAPFIPHLYHYIWMHPAGDFNYEVWTTLDFEWLEVCHAFYLITQSPGAKAELERAQEMGIPIYTQLQDVPNLLEDIE